MAIPEGFASFLATYHENHLSDVAVIDDLTSSYEKDVINLGDPDSILREVVTCAISAYKTGAVLTDCPFTDAYLCEIWRCTFNECQQRHSMRITRRQFLYVRQAIEPTEINWKQEGF
jgi:hypothetical protein